MSSNVFLFNWTSVRCDDLSCKLQALGNKVQLYSEPSFAEVLSARQRLMVEDFSPFKYVFLAIFDERAGSACKVRTSDNVHIFYNEELLAYLKLNATMRTKRCYILVQKQSPNLEGYVLGLEESVHPQPPEGPLLDGDFCLMTVTEYNSLWQSPFLRVFCDLFVPKFDHLDLCRLWSGVKSEIKRQRYFCKLEMVYSCPDVLVMEKHST